VWELTLRELKDDDVRALNERTLSEHEKQQREQRTAAGNRMVDDTREGVVVEGALGEGRRQLSWIWFSVSNDENSPDMHEGHFYQNLIFYSSVLMSLDVHSSPG
jgi:hypothetical protein